MALQLSAKESSWRSSILHKYDFVKQLFGHFATSWREDDSCCTEQTLNSSAA